MKTKLWVLAAIIAVLLLAIARAGDVQIQDGELNSEKLRVTSLPTVAGGSGTKGIVCVDNDGTFWVDIIREGAVCGLWAP